MAGKNKAYRADVLTWGVGIAAGGGFNPKPSAGKFDPNNKRNRGNVISPASTWLLKRKNNKQPWTLNTSSGGYGNIRNAGGHYSLCKGSSSFVCNSQGNKLRLYRSGQLTEPEIFAGR